MDCSWQTARLLFLNSTSRVRAGFCVLLLRYGESFVFHPLNGIVFLIIGLELRDVPDGLKSGRHTADVPRSAMVRWSPRADHRIVQFPTWPCSPPWCSRPEVAPRGSHTTADLAASLVAGMDRHARVVSPWPRRSPPPLALPMAATSHRSLVLFITFVVILLCARRYKV